MGRRWPARVLRVTQVGCEVEYDDDLKTRETIEVGGDVWRADARRRGVERDVSPLFQKKTLTFFETSRCEILSSSALSPQVRCLGDTGYQAEFDDDDARLLEGSDFGVGLAEDDFDFEDELAPALAAPCAAAAPRVCGEAEDEGSSDESSLDESAFCREIAQLAEDAALEDDCELFPVTNPRPLAVRTND